MNIEPLFLKFSVDKLRQLNSRIDACLGQLTDEQVWARGGDNRNSIGNLMLHLAGNVRQWIVASLAERPFARDRDAEFSARGGQSATQLAAILHDAVEQAAQVIAGLDVEKLTWQYDIQVYRVSGVEAVYHVVEHFAEHTGQIIFITKMLTGGDLGFYRLLSEAGNTPGLP